MRFDTLQSLMVTNHSIHYNQRVTTLAVLLPMGFKFLSSATAPAHPGDIEQLDSDTVNNTATVVTTVR